MNTLLDQCAEIISSGRWADLEELIDATPELVNTQDLDGRTLLITCARCGGTAHILRKLLEVGANPNHRANDGSTALAAAIVGGSVWGLTTIPELVTLLELGADPNAVADAGMPALHWAISQNRLEHARVLLAGGADALVGTSDTPTETAYQVAQRIGSRDALCLLKEAADGKQV